MVRRRKVKKEGLNLKVTTALILIIFILGFGGTMWFYALYKVVHVEIHDIKIKVVEGTKVGFNADSSLEFGKIPEKGGTANKKVVLYNDREFPVMVQIRIKGEVAQFIQLEDNNFILAPGEEKLLNVYAVVPRDFNKPGNYTGEAKIIFFRT